LSTDTDVKVLLQPFGGLFGRITVTRGNCSHEVSLDNSGKFGWSNSLAAWSLYFVPFGNDMDYRASDAKSLGGLTVGMSILEKQKDAVFFVL